MEVKKGYRLTEIGIIPEDWEVVRLGEVFNTYSGGTPRRDQEKYWKGNIPWLKSGELVDSIVTSTEEFISYEALINSSLKFVENDTMLLAMYGATAGKLGLTKTRITINQAICAIVPKRKLSIEYYFFFLMTIREILLSMRFGAAQPNLNQDIIKKILIPLPPLPEQTAIANALSDINALIESLEKLITKKRNIKQGAMQQLLTGKKRLPGFVGEWELKTIMELTNCLDHLRIPLNDNQRLNMKGDYPYCGANGVLDYIDQYLIDDDIILIAEDGGYFDEYNYRPIAYRMKGQCWVNNHAHILKAKDGYSQDYIFYSLVHKNILNFLTGGTRAKLNKSEMYKIEIFIPSSFEEQITIAEVLSDMDSEIEALEKKLNKYKKVKQGMMQELLTGKKRLI